MKKVVIFILILNLQINVLLNSEVSTFIGKQGSSGLQNAQGVNAQFSDPYQIVYSNRENSLFIADCGNNLIRKVTMDGNE